MKLELLILEIVQDFVASQKRPKSTRVTRVIQGYETHSFKSNFDSWPSGSSATTAGAEEGRGKVAGGHYFFSLVMVLNCGRSNFHGLV